MEGNVLYIILLISSVLSLGNCGCAPSEDIHPCNCVQKRLRCGNINEEELRDVFIAQKRHASGFILDGIEFFDYKMSYIPSGLLSGIYFYRLEVNTSTLLSFHDPHKNLSAFDGAEDKLTMLTINYYGHPIENFDWSSLSPLRNLTHLYIEGSFAAIRTPLPLLPTVDVFWLRDTGVYFIAENALDGLTEVREISLRGNPMKAYTRKMFPSIARKLTTFITMEDNVTVLPEDFFDNMPLLQHVQIPYQVHNIPPIESIVPTNLTVGFGLTCDSRLKWLLRMRDEGKVNILLARCRRPLHLRFRTIDNLTMEDI